jgi:adenylosuccinate synthase
MGATVIVDALFGDSGKGKLGAYLALTQQFDYSIEAGTGPSATHEFLLNDGRRIHTRQLPAGWIAGKTQLRIGPGVLIQLEVLHTEIAQLAEWNVGPRLAVDGRCGLVRTTHLEQEKQDPFINNSIGFEAGTTAARGDYIWRKAQRIADIPDPKVVVTDVALELNQAALQGKRLLVHGAHGTLLSLYLGRDYPYTTSDNCTAGASANQIGLAWPHIEEVIMVVKALPTRTDSGKLPEEMTIEELEARGLVSFGHVSGKLRRVARGLSSDLVRYACMLNAPTALAIGCADLADPQVRGATQSHQVTKPIWTLIHTLEQWCQVPVRYVSTGPALGEIVELKT